MTTFLPSGPVPVSREPQTNRRTRSWTSNGVHFTVETTSFSTGSIPLFTSSGTSSRRTRTGAQSRGHAALFGGALGGILDGFFPAATQQQHASVETPRHEIRRPAIGRRTEVEVEVESDHDDEESNGLAYGTFDSDDDSRDDTSDDDDFNGHSARRPSLMNRLKHKFGDSSKKNVRGNASQQDDPRQQTNPRSKSYQTEERVPGRTRRRPRQSSGDFASDSEGDDTSDEETLPPRRPSNAPRSSNATLIAALQAAARSEQRAVKTAQHRYDQAVRHSTVTREYLRDLRDDIRRHERSLQAVKTHIREALAEEEDKTPPHRPRPSTARSRPFRPRHASYPSSHPFPDPMPGFTHFFADSQHPDPVFRAFENFGPSRDSGFFDPFFAHAGFSNLYETIEAIQRDLPGARFTASASGGVGGGGGGGNGTLPRTTRPKPTHFTSAGGPQYRRNPVATPVAPPTLLAPEEAQRLFAVYNERWNSLPSHDADIPYPARHLQAQSLRARDTLWAPHLGGARVVATWSDEVVMQANVQAFFLGVVGLLPVYTEAPGTGRVEMGFERARASPAQLKQLVDLLKKEKTRWHSDRLGRRNGGRAGEVNEALQRDERARAVFHAVCELMNHATAPAA